MSSNDKDPVVDMEMVALNDPDPAARFTATQRLPIGHPALEKIAVEDSHCAVRSEAVERLADGNLRLFEKIAVEDADIWTRWVAFDRLPTGHPLVERLAIDGPSLIRRSAVMRLPGGHPLLAKIATEDTDAIARIWAKRRMADEQAVDE